MRLTHECPIDHKELRLTDSSIFNDGSSLNSFTCGHVFFKNPNEWIVPTFNSIDGSGHHARPYQEKSVTRVLNPPAPNVPFNHIVAHKMRLGKTPISLLALASDYKNRTPILIIVRSANVYQWLKEYRKWTDSLPNGVYVVDSTKALIIPGFSAYLMSMDTFSRPGTCTTCKHSMSNHGDDMACTNKKCNCRFGVDSGDSVASRLLKLGIKVVIADEAHSFKNLNSARSQALVKFLHEIEGDTGGKMIKFACSNCSHVWDVKARETVNIYKKEIVVSEYCPLCNTLNVHQSIQEDVSVERKCGIIMLTGTPIKNRADEFFVPLNIVAPEKFPSLAAFQRQWLIPNEKGKYTRINPKKWEDFQSTIEPYYTRYEYEDVYTDLPPLNRMFQVVKVEDENLKKAYNTVLDTIEMKMDRGNYSFFNSIGELAMLRRICALAKIDWVLEYVEEYLDDNDKICIGLHHHDVRDNLLHYLKNYGVVKLDGNDSAERKYEVMTQFRNSSDRICLLGMQAAKEGLEFPYINRAVCLERMWSAAEEEQFEKRFYNPDKDYLESVGIDRNKITEIEYGVAAGTIDEFFFDMNEEKRHIFDETVGNKWELSEDPDSFKLLMERTVGGRL